MWKKESTDNSNFESRESSNFEPTFKKPQPQAHSPARTEAASIGHTITIDGKISGDEDLVIQGKIIGEIKLSKHTLSVGRNGTVNASILAKIVKVDGEIKGDIEGSERVIINESGRVYGNIKSPRVVLKDGSRFKGNIDMQQEENTSSQSSQGLQNNQKQSENLFKGADNKPNFTTNSSVLDKKVDSEKKKIDLKNL